MQNDDVVEPPRDHKLCGYVRAVLTTPSPSPPISIHSQCRVSSDPQTPNFTVQDDVVLSPIVSPRTTPGTKKRHSRLGIVDGSISVVRQIHALVAHKCIKVVARVLGVSKREIGEIRVLVLVDVYLPTALWSGWQFPKSGHVAAALFKHLSCDWEARSLMFKSNTLDYIDQDIWNLTDCHVLGCKWHCMVPDNDKRKKLFEIQEIFKSLPSVIKKVDCDGSRVKPADSSRAAGIWSLSDDIMINILAFLSPIELVRISSTCHHFRYLAASVMPCMKLKLYPHQQAAIEWMLQREKGCEIVPHPLYMNFITEDGFELSINTISGGIVTCSFPTITDFRGGMFCDEPGLGKTITALSLILKAQGTVAEPPDKAHMIWCMHDANKKCGYYEVPAHDKIIGGGPKNNNFSGYKTRRGQLSLDELTPKGTRSVCTSNISRCFYSSEQTFEPADLSSDKRVTSHASVCSTPETPYERRSRSLSNVKKNLLDEFDEPSLAYERISKRRKRSSLQNRRPMDNQVASTHGMSLSRKRNKEAVNYDLEPNETWVQCDACGKWRKLLDSATNISTAWFCSMNSDPLYQSCNIPEESWDKKESITCLRGFHTKGTPGGQVENTTFFVGVLKEHHTLITSETKKALIWLVKLSPEKVAEMETVGLVSPTVGTAMFDTRVARDYHKVFLAFGLIKRIVKGTMKWYYPSNLSNLSFDLDALRIALCEPLDTVRLYLSSATLIVVPSNLVDHWINQISQHIQPGQLRVYVWGDQKIKPSANDLAWDYDVVITTFSRLSAEWDPRKRSVLTQVHWLRVMLDEGHTLGSSLTLTNKFQMVVSLTATNRWLLTGTPTPTTPNSQLSYLQTVLKFLKEEAYGLHQKSWETGIVLPFEAEMEEGRFRLLQLLNRCMISARKADLSAIPPCIKKVTYVDFSEEHAKSYNEFVETVRRNILMADWNDPSHVESLLNPKQWKLRAATIKNIRLSCCVAGHVRMTDAGQDIQETMDVFVEKNGLDPISEEYALIKYKLVHGGNCMRCKEWCRLPVITPCRHFLCLDCVALDSERCTFPGCGKLYEMQSPEDLARPENPNPKWPVPKDLIELQPSYKQDAWNPDWQSTSSSKVTYLIHRLKEIQQENQIRCFNDDVNVTSLDWEACNNKSMKQPMDKVIIFSQFLEHIHVIEQQLTVVGIRFAGMYSPMPSANKMKSLATFQHEANCMVLLMDGSAALGLDLSSVTYVYLMEPIWDRSVEEQVISRAHRLGATRPIHVETLAMRGTIEEQMLKFLQDGEECRRLLKEELGTNDPQPQTFRTLHDFAQNNYLVHLSFVRTDSSGKPKGYGC